LTDPAFAGSDTLATAYTLSLAIKRLSPDLVFTGKKTLIGDTAQTGIMLATLSGLGLVTEVMEIEEIGEAVSARTREEGVMTAKLPALLTFERICELRLPRLRSKLGELEILSAEDLSADIARCGFEGSPTRVVKTFENQSGRRRCKFISRSELNSVIKSALEKSEKRKKPPSDGKKLDTGRVICVKDAPLSMARDICLEPEITEELSVDGLIRIIEEKDPDAVIFGCDARSKRIAAMLAARLSLGLCADCTSLEWDGEDIYMYRPALSGSIIAKVKSKTRPTLATVRTESEIHSDITVALGFGVKDDLDRARSFADSLGAELASSRKMTDSALIHYEHQVGLTGKTVSPAVYIAIGISGAVHHIVGMQNSGTVIAINPDKDAPVFDYSDYGILEKF